MSNFNKIFKHLYTEAVNEYRNLIKEDPPGQGINNPNSSQYRFNTPERKKIIQKIKKFEQLKQNGNPNDHQLKRIQERLKQLKAQKDKIDQKSPAQSGVSDSSSAGVSDNKGDNKNDNKDKKENNQQFPDSYTKYVKTLANDNYTKYYESIIEKLITNDFTKNYYAVGKPGFSESVNEFINKGYSGSYVLILSSNPEKTVQIQIVDEDSEQEEKKKTQKFPQIIITSIRKFKKFDIDKKIRKEDDQVIDILIGKDEGQDQAQAEADKKTADKEKEEKIKKVDQSIKDYYQQAAVPIAKTKKCAKDIREIRNKVRQLISGYQSLQNADDFIKEGKKAANDLALYTVDNGKVVVFTTDAIQKDKEKATIKYIKAVSIDDFKQKKDEYIKVAKDFLKDEIKNLKDQVQKTSDQESKDNMQQILELLMKAFGGGSMFGGGTNDKQKKSSEQDKNQISEQSKKFYQTFNAQIENICKNCDLDGFNDCRLKDTDFHDQKGSTILTWKDEGQIDSKKQINKLQQFFTDGCKRHANPADMWNAVTALYNSIPSGKRQTKQANAIKQSILNIQPSYKAWKEFKNNSSKQKQAQQKNKDK